MRPQQFLARFPLLLGCALPLACGPCWSEDAVFLKELEPRLLKQALTDSVVSEEECLDLCGYGYYAASEEHPSEVDSCTLTWEGDLEAAPPEASGAGGRSSGGASMGGLGGQAVELGGLGGDGFSLGGFAGTPVSPGGSGGTASRPTLVVRCDIIGLPAICPE